MSEYADGFDDGKGEKFDELMVEIVNLRLDFQNCEAKRVGAINSLREHINICNWLKIENAALREQLAASKQEVEVQKAKAEKHYELGTEYFDLMVKAEREIAALRLDAERYRWLPIDSAPMDNKRPLLLASFNSDDGTLQGMDYDGSWESERESWEVPEVYWYWASAENNVEEPTHWMYQPDWYASIDAAMKEEGK
jgi:hypothetical protein